MKFVAWKTSVALQKAQPHCPPFRVNEADPQGYVIPGTYVCSTSSLAKAQLIAEALGKSGITHEHLRDATIAP